MVGISGTECSCSSCRQRQDVTWVGTCNATEYVVYTTSNISEFEQAMEEIIIEIKKSFSRKVDKIKPKIQLDGNINPFSSGKCNYGQFR